VTVASSQMQMTPSRGPVRQPHSRRCTVLRCHLPPRWPPCRIHRYCDPPICAGPAERDLLQRPPRCRHRRRRPGQLSMIGHDPEIEDHPGADHDRTRQIDRHPAPVDGGRPGGSAGCAGRTRAARSDPPSRAALYDRHRGADFNLERSPAQRRRHDEAPPEPHPGHQHLARTVREHHLVRRHRLHRTHRLLVVPGLPIGSSSTMNPSSRRAQSANAEWCPAASTTHPILARLGEQSPRPKQGPAFNHCSGRCLSHLS
jgi:hypothetical protein